MSATPDTRANGGAETSAPAAEARPVVLWLSNQNIDASPRSAAYTLQVVKSPEQAAALIVKTNVDIFVADACLAPQKIKKCFAEIRARNARAQGIIFGVDEHTSLFADFVNDSSLYYLAHGQLPLSQLVPLIESAVAQKTRPPAATTTLVESLVLAPDPLAFFDRVRSAAAQALKATQARLLVYDLENDVLYAEDRGAERREDSAAVGLASFALRTKRPVRVAAVGADGRYDADIDAPSGKGSERFVAVPIVDLGGRALGVLTALRGAEAAAFGEQDVGTLEQLAQLIAPTLLSLAPGRHEPSHPVFRDEALAHHAAPRPTEAELVRLEPGWTAWGFWLLIAMALFSLVFSFVARVNEYASGVAVVQGNGQNDLISGLGGTVTWVGVAPGERVRKGQVVVRFYDAGETAELNRTQHEFETQLANYLRDPGNTQYRQAIATLRAAKELAEAKAAERQMRAAQDGVIGDVRVRVGQVVEPGQTILSLVGEGSHFSLVALLPGRYRPELKNGAALRFELSGFDRVSQYLEVASIGEQVVGTNEAKRYLGQDNADAAPEGPAIVVRATLPTATFTASDREYRYFPGMRGTAEVRVRSTPIVALLFPSLKRFFGEH